MTVLGAHWRLVLIETQGNQAYVFASNKRREQFGASEQILRSTTEWLMVALGNRRPASERFADDVADWLTDATRNPPIEGAAGKDFEVLIATSGKALLLARDHDKARELIRDLCLKAERDAPGLTLMGAVSPEVFTLGSAGDFHKRLKAIHDRLSALKGRLAPSMARFLRLPFSEECRSTGAAAAGFDDKDPDLKEGNVVAYSAESLGKRAFIPIARERLTMAYDGRLDLSDLGDPTDTGDPAPTALAQTTIDTKSELDSDRRREFDWWGVVHADGNGLGQFFLRFDECLSPHATARDYVTALRDFSLRLEACTRKAAIEALNLVWREPGPSAQLKPLILAGDDLTVVCDGSKAVAFARAYLEAFNRLTGEDADMNSLTEMGVVKGILRSAALTAAAGVAVVKPHHPFHRAYELAEALTQSAKKSKTLPVADSALDFYIAFDQASDLQEIRARLSAHGGPNWGGPYLLGSAQTCADDVSMRSIVALDTSVAAMRERQTDDPERLVLPRNALHDLRRALHDSIQAVEVAVERLKHRQSFSGAFRLRLFGADGPRDAAKPHSTLLLDAMELAQVAPPAPPESGGP